MEIAMSAKSERAAVALSVKMAGYAASIFTSALLLFLIQPMIARALLPRFGGAAAVWIVCLMLFQLLLLLGYLYAHWCTSHLDPHTQGILHLLLLAAGTIAAWRTPLSLAGGGNPLHPSL